MTSGAGSVASASASGVEITVNLTGVVTGQTIAVTLFNVNDGTNTGNVVIPMGVLVGDSNANGTVNASDVSQTKARLGQTITSANFRSDVNANGGINGSDVSLVKSRLGTGLP